MDISMKSQDVASQAADGEAVASRLSPRWRPGRATSVIPTARGAVAAGHIGRLEHGE